MYNEYKLEKQRLERSTELLTIDARLTATYIAQAVFQFTTLDYLIDQVLKFHVELAKDDIYKQEAQKILSEKFVDFSKKIPIVENIASYAGIAKFNSGRFINCAGQRNNILHGFYRILDDENGVPCIFILNKQKDGKEKQSRPKELAEDLKHSIDLCYHCLDEIFELMHLPKYGELSYA